LTAHALRALSAWGAVSPLCSGDGGGPPLASSTSSDGKRVNDVPPTDDPRHSFIHWGFTYLERQQRPDGSWLPLWFGNQHAPDDENPTYGTARVLAAYRDLNRMNTAPARRGVAWLLSAQNADGSWGGAANTPSSIEETALAVEVLLNCPDCRGAVNRGLLWLVQQVESGGLDHPTPIGFYFAKLWYFERLYPIIFTVAALGRARRDDKNV
jgi:squalene-hopene/tetraprenyl-beta-curcumene cyclase